MERVGIDHLLIGRLGAGTRASAVASDCVLVGFALCYVSSLLGLGLSLRQELNEPAVTLYAGLHEQRLIRVSFW